MSGGSGFENILQGGSIDFKNIRDGFGITRGGSSGFGNIQGGSSGFGNIQGGSLGFGNIQDGSMGFVYRVVDL